MTQAHTGRTIAQISSHPGAFGTGHNKTAPGVYALCTDGTLWWRAQGREHTWTQLQPIPMENQCEN